MRTTAFNGPGVLLRACALLALTGINAMAENIEEPAYTLLYSLGSVEVREYEAAVQAVTTLPGSNSTSGGFRRLAGFIFGGNSEGESIAMTAPVQETLGTDAPVMAFTMPSAYSIDDLPEPNDSRVALIEVPQRTAAVISFSGWATAGKIKKYTGQLLAALEAQNVAVVSDVMLNQYNPPWTPPFMRRNEIMVDIELPEMASAGTAY